jgi:hypothetical protein
MKVCHALDSVGSNYKQISCDGIIYDSLLTTALASFNPAHKTSHM